MSDHELLLEIYKHVQIMNGEFGDLCVKVAVLESQMDDMRQLMWIIVGAVVATLVSLIIGGIIINNKVKK